MKRRISIITIILALVIIAVIAVIMINISKKIEKKNDNEKPNYEYTNYIEEDMMPYEYEKMDSSLNGLYALAIQNDYLVGITKYDNFVNIYNIESGNSYSYDYDNGKVYVAENNTGKLTIIDLNTFTKEENEIDLNSNIEQIEVNDNTIYYLANGKYYEYDGKASKLLYDNVTSHEFILKKDYLYLCINNTFYKIDENGQKSMIDENVKDIHYYDYYERDKIIYDKSMDENNTIKYAYNIFLGSSSSYIKNNIYFIPYEANKYIYITNDRKSAVIINDKNINKYLFNIQDNSDLSKETINNIAFCKDGYLRITTKSKEIVIDLNSENVEESDNIMNLQNIKYLK